MPARATLTPGSAQEPEKKASFSRDVQKLMLDATFTSNQTSPVEQTLLGEQSLDTGNWAQPCS